MDSVKRKCKSWIVYFKKVDSFHLFHLIVETLDVFNFHTIFFYCYHQFHTHVRDLNKFLKKSIKSGNIIEKKNKTLKDFLVFLNIIKCRQNRKNRTE